MSYNQLRCGSEYIPKRNAYCFRCGKNLKAQKSVVNLLRGSYGSWKRLTCPGCVIREDKKAWKLCELCSKSDRENGE